MVEVVGLGLPVVQPIEVIQAALGEEPLTWKLWQSRVRWELTPRLTPDERVCFAAARRQGWLLQRRGGRRVGNTWYLWCRACRMPCVRVQPGSRWARIRVDLDFGELDLVDVARAAQALRGASQGHLWASETLVMADRVPVDAAEEVAAAVARLLGCAAAV